MKFNENEIKKIFNNIGSIPITSLSIESRVEKGLSLDDFISMTVSGTRNKLKGFKHQLILKALKDHPDGIRPKFFKKLNNKGVDLSDPKAVSMAMIESDAIIYHIELDKYTI